MILSLLSVICCTNDKCITMDFSLYLVGFLGGYELIAVGLIVLLLFGGKKLPELMKGLGSGIREFNNAKSNIQSELKESLKDTDAKS